MSGSRPLKHIPPSSSKRFPISFGLCESV
jgi:hypothetical protein